MKKYILNVKSFAGLCSLLLMFGGAFGFSSCKETIDDSNFAIKSELTITDYLIANEDLSKIREIFGKVRLGNDSASFMTAVLSARGNYTVFAPTNAAVDAYLAEEGLTSVDEMDREQLEQIAKSCVIDNGDLAAYETADFPSKGAFGTPNLNNRELSCEEKTDSIGIISYVINGTSLVLEDDIDLSNGVLHVVGTVVNPSSDYLAKSLGLAGNMQVMNHLMLATAWADTLNKKEYNLDVEYEKEERELTYNLNNVAPFTVAQHRYIGFTAFVEPDNLYEEWLGVTLVKDENNVITNWDAEVLPKLKEKCIEVYGSMGDAIDNDLTHADNAVNRFVAYHLIYGKMAYNKLVAHFNEFEYKYGDMTRPQTSSYPTNVWDYFTTMGKHRSLLKITQVGDNSLVDTDQGKRIYVNRISEYANGRDDNYHEKAIKERGACISATNEEFDNNALNGYYFPIDEILLYDNDIRKKLAAERMRIDVSTMLPELLTNNVRGGVYVRFPNGYFDNIINEADDTKLLYLHAGSVGGTGWNDYQGDEFMVSGLYDFTMKLPPVPVDGTYELRMGVAQNSLRGMCQIYFGSEPNKLTPAGLPYDMRQVATEDNVAIPWVADGEDDLVNAENDKNLRNQGYMKGPNYHCLCDGTAETPIRQRGGEYAALRRIITTANMEANKTYYLRFKTALKKTDSQFFMDFFEIVPTNVYNGTLPEDIW